MLEFLRFRVDPDVTRVCRNVATYAREALSADYGKPRVIILDGIRFLRDEASIATKLSWLPLKLGLLRVVLLLYGGTKSKTFDKRVCDFAFARLWACVRTCGRMRDFPLSNCYVVASLDLHEEK